MVDFTENFYNQKILLQRAAAAAARDAEKLSKVENARPCPKGRRPKQIGSGRLEWIPIRPDRMHVYPFVLKNFLIEKTVPPDRKNL